MNCHISNTYKSLLIENYCIGLKVTVQGVTCCLV